MIRTKVYLHSNKESMYDKGKEIGLVGKALAISSTPVPKLS